MKLYYIHNNFLSLIKLLLITSAEILLGNSKILLPYYSIYITASGFYANKITNWTYSRYNLFMLYSTDSE
jgi:hypothetical protein